MKKLAAAFGGKHAAMMKPVLAEKLTARYQTSRVESMDDMTPLRTLAEIRADILALEQMSEGLLHKIVGGA